MVQVNQTLLLGLFHLVALDDKKMCNAVTSQSVNQIRSILLQSTCWASVSLQSTGASIHWTTLTEVEVTLIIIQGVVLRTNTECLCVVLWIDMAWEGGPLRAWQWAGGPGVDTRYNLLGLGCAGGHCVMPGDLRDGFFGVLVLGLLCSFSFTTGNLHECNRNYRQEGQEAGDVPHG